MDTIPHQRDLKSSNLLICDQRIRKYCDLNGLNIENVSQPSPTSFRYLIKNSKNSLQWDINFYELFHKPNIQGQVRVISNFLFMTNEEFEELFAYLKQE